MKSRLRYRLLLPTGLFMLIAGLLISHFGKVQDTYQGALMGGGIGVMIVALVKQRQLKRSRG